MNHSGKIETKFHILTAAVLIVSMLVSPCGMIMTGHADFAFFASNHNTDQAAGAFLWEAVTNSSGWLESDCEFEVIIPSAGSKAYFGFTPKLTGIYTIKGTGECSGQYTVCRLYNEYGELLCESDNEGNGSNFNLTYHLRQGITYYYEAGLGGNATGTYMAAFSEALAEDPVNATELELGYDTELSTIKAYEVCFVKLEPGRTVEYLLFSSETNSDPVIWIYDSDYDQVTMNDDGAGGGNFKAETILTAGETYYAVIGFDRDRCGGLKLNTMSDPELEAGAYYFRNNNSEKLISYFGNRIRLYSFDNGISQRLYVNRGNGYYTISIEEADGLSVGVSSGLTVTAAAGGNYRWKIYEDAAHKCLLESVDLSGYIAVPERDGDEFRIATERMCDYSNPEESGWTLIKAIYGSQPFRELNMNEVTCINCMGYAMGLSYSPDFDLDLEGCALDDFWNSSSFDITETIFIEVEASNKTHFENWLENAGYVFEYEADFADNGQSRRLASNQYRIVLRIGLINPEDENDDAGYLLDYHFWYQTYDGTWANKHGSSNPEHLSEGITPFSTNATGWDNTTNEVLYHNFYNGTIYTYIITMFE